MPAAPDGLRDLFAPGAEPFAPPPGSRADAVPGERPEHAISISVLTALIHQVVDGAFLPLWIRGEVTHFKRQRSGHCYFTLRDESSTVKCVMWANSYHGPPPHIVEGLTVVARGRVTTYQKRGELQVDIREVQPVGDGAWRAVFEATRQRLEADGLLDRARKRALPAYPRCVAVITSREGAAYRDIVSVIRERSPITDIVLIPATVQGEDAPRALRKALSRLAKWDGADVLIIGRGGGSREDLWAFNDEALARALARCSIPTISAVGHEVDITICDLVADRRAPTPSAAAEMAVPRVQDLRAMLAERANVLRRQVGRLAELGRTRLGGLARNMELQSQRLIEARRLRLKALAMSLHALSPLATLGRGYAAVFDAAGNPVTDVRQLAENDAVRVRLRDGSFRGRVESVSPGDTT